MSNKQDYDFYKSIGICIRCHKKNSEPNRIMCFECAEREREKDRIKYERNIETIKHRDSNKYYELKLMGICTYCKHEKAVPGKTKCKKCIAKIRCRRNRNRHDISRSERRSYGICYICGNNAVISGKGVCEDCYNTRKIAIQKCLDSRPDEFNEYWKHENKLLFGGH